MRKILFLLCCILVLGYIIICTPLYAQQPQPTKNLPVIEFKGTGNVDYYVIFLTGNGGWRPLAKAVTQYLNSKNISVLVINSMKYLHSEKKPAQIAADLEAVMNQYNTIWGKGKVILLGYSMGAEVLPFAVNNMDDKYKNELKDLVLIAPWQNATFKDKMIYHFFDTDNGADIYTELIKLKSFNTYIICDDSKYSICLKDINGLDDHDFLKGGHHFGGDYDALSELIGKRLHLE
jgi:type IV secretory pathway VirJ component